MTRRNEDLAPPSNNDFEAERRRRKELAEQRRAQTAALIDDAAAGAAAAYVSYAWETTGTGPTWRELGRHIGWSSAQTNACAWELRRRGVLDYTTEHRSLHVAKGRSPIHPLTTTSDDQRRPATTSDDAEKVASEGANESEPGS